MVGNAFSVYEEPSVEIKLTVRALKKIEQRARRKVSVLSGIVGVDDFDAWRAVYLRRHLEVTGSSI